MAALLERSALLSATGVHGASSHDFPRPLCRYSRPATLQHGSEATFNTYQLCATPLRDATPRSLCSPPGSLKSPVTCNADAHKLLVNMKVDALNPLGRDLSAHETAWCRLIVDLEMNLGDTNTRTVEATAAKTAAVALWQPGGRACPGTLWLDVPHHTPAGQRSAIAATSSGRPRHYRASILTPVVLRSVMVWTL